MHAVLHHKKRVDSLHKGSGITIVPNVAANPTIGAQLGIKAVAGRRLGPDSTTFLSVGATSATVTSKGILFLYLNHNIFTAGNKYNFQGNLVASKTVSPDYGFGIGRDLPTTGANHVLEDPLTQSVSLYILTILMPVKRFIRKLQRIYFWGQAWILLSGAI